MSRIIELADNECAVVFRADDIDMRPSVGLEERLDNDEQLTSAEFCFLLTVFLFGEDDFAKQKWQEIADYMEAT